MMEMTNDAKEMNTHVLCRRCPEDVHGDGKLDGIPAREELPI